MQFINVSVIGVRQISYTNQSGRAVKGKEVHFAFDDPNMIGGRVGTVYVPDSAGINVEPKQELRIIWDRQNRQRPYSYLDPASL